MKTRSVVSAVAFLLAVALGVTACSGKKSGETVNSEAAGKDVIGISKFVSHPALDSIEQGIMDELADRGFDLEYDLQNANADPNTAASIASKFKADKVKAAIGIATPTAQALVNVIRDLPVVFSAVTDPVAAGLVTTLDRGEGNVTGISDMTPVKEQIQLLASSKLVKRLGHVYSSSEANAVTLAGIARDTAREMGMEFVEASVTTSAEVRQATQSIIDRVDALYVSTDNTVVSAFPSLLDVALKKGVPVMSADPSSAETYDVLLAYGFNYYKMGRASGRMVAEILEGKAPSEMPTRFMTDASDLDLLVNLDVAGKLGVTVPENILAKATKIVENGKLTEK